MSQVPKRFCFQPVVVPNKCSSIQTLLISHFTNSLIKQYISYAFFITIYIAIRVKARYAKVSHLKNVFNFCNLFKTPHTACMTNHSGIKIPTLGITALCQYCLKSMYRVLSLEYPMAHEYCSEISSNNAIKPLN